MGTRGLVRSCAIATLLFSVGQMPAQAQSFPAAFPARSVRMIVPYAPAGVTDALARMVAARSAEILGQQIVIENRAGGSGVIGAGAVASAPPDGYTVLFIDSSFSVNPALVKNLPFDPRKNFAPVSLIANAPVLLLIHPSVKAQSVTEFVALLRKEPGKLAFASPGSGTFGHLAAEILRISTKTDMLNVPYKGAGPAMVDLLSGQISMMFVGTSVSKQHVETGKLRALAITGKRRSDAVPQVPTFADAGLPMPLLEDNPWWGVFAPAGTPAEVIAVLNNTFARTLGDASIVQRLRDLTFDPMPGKPEELGRLLESEMAKWKLVIDQAGLKAE